MRCYYHCFRGSKRRSVNSRLSTLNSFIFGLFVLTSLSLARADDPSPLGTWLADDGKSHVEVSRCGAQLCGTAVWLKSSLDAAGTPRTDSKNPDAALRSRPLIGLQVLQGLVQDDSGPGQWEDGTIYDPESGSTYKCTLTMEGPNMMRVCGYVGIALFGKTQTWTRLS